MQRIKMGEAGLGMQALIIGARALECRCTRPKTLHLIFVKAIISILTCVLSRYNPYFMPIGTLPIDPSLPPPLMPSHYGSRSPPPLRHYGLSGGVFFVGSGVNDISYLGVAMIIVLVDLNGSCCNEWQYHVLTIAISMLQLTSLWQSWVACLLAPQVSSA
jgi:hypothetical protein